MNIEADRIKNVQFSAIRKVLDKASALRNEGKRVIALSAGEPNFNTPEPIKEECIRAINENYTHYGSNKGNPELRKIISKKIKEESGKEYDPESEIMFTTGGAEALNNIILALVNPGDEVIIISPAFVSYKNLVILCGGIPVEVPVLSSDNFIPDMEAVRRAVSDKTRMLIINNPNNPTGAVYSKEILQELCDLSLERDFFILSDEMYSSLVYEGSFCPVSSFDNMKDHVIVVNGFSKTYAMTGWRLGYLYTSREILMAILKVHQYSSTCSPTFIQKGMVWAIESEGTTEAVKAMMDEFAARRQLTVSLLEKINGISFVKPNGAFYVLLDVSETGLDGEGFADELLKEELVAVVPAISMGKDDFYKNYVRISFAASREDITEGINKIGEFVNRKVRS